VETRGTRIKPSQRSSSEFLRKQKSEILISLRMVMKPPSLCMSEEQNYHCVNPNIIYWSHTQFISLSNQPLIKKNKKQILYHGDVNRGLNVEFVKISNGRILHCLTIESRTKSTSLQRLSTNPVNNP